MPSRHTNVRILRNAKKQKLEIISPPPEGAGGCGLICLYLVAERNEGVLMMSSLPDFFSSVVADFTRALVGNFQRALLCGGHQCEGQAEEVSGRSEQKVSEAFKGAMSFLLGVVKLSRRDTLEVRGAANKPVHRYLLMPCVRVLPLSVLGNEPLQGEGALGATGQDDKGRLPHVG